MPLTRNGRNEISYYSEIQSFIETQLKSNFRARNNRELEVFWGIGELKTNLQRILRENPEKCACASTFAQRTAPLNLDIFALITDGRKFEILILEIKLLSGVGLKEWSQLVGYCLVSGAKYGLLINIDNGASSRLSQLLSTEEHLSRIQTVINNQHHEHNLGMMYWDSLTHCFDYSNLGVVKSLSDLSARLSAEFIN